MERIELNDELIDLGAVAVETRGGTLSEIENFVQQPAAGISDD